MKRSRLVVGLILSLAIAIFLSHAVPLTSLAQTNRVLPVAVGDNATVRLTRGGSRSGQLTALTPTSLTLANAGQSQTLGISEVQRLELRGQVAIANPDGRVTPIRIRGVSQLIPNVPVTALTWSGRPSLASLNLQGVLSQAEFNHLTADPSLVYALTQMEFESVNRTTMNVRVKALKKP